MDIKIKKKLQRMNKNMANYLKGQGIDCKLNIINKDDIDNDQTEEFIPIYKLTGNGKTNKKFNYTIAIDPEKEFEITINLNEIAQFKLENNSQIKFAITNFQVLDIK